MANQDLVDPYALRPESIEVPPNTVIRSLQRIGPGLITAATVVGTGELIATTVLGAENGYRLLWLVIVSCLIKVVVQNEMGRYTVGTGETALQGPEPRSGTALSGLVGGLDMVPHGGDGLDGAQRDVRRHRRSAQPHRPSDHH